MSHDCTAQTKKGLIDSWKKLLAADDQWTQEILKQMEPEVAHKRVTDLLLHFLNFLEEKGCPVFSSCAPKKRNMTLPLRERVIQEYSNTHEDYFLLLRESAAIFGWTIDCPFKKGATNLLISYRGQENHIWGRAVCLEYALDAIERLIFYGTKDEKDVGTENADALQKLFPITAKRIETGEDCVRYLRRSQNSDFTRAFLPSGSLFVGCFCSKSFSARIHPGQSLQSPPSKSFRSFKGL